MSATNILCAKPPALDRRGFRAAGEAFAKAANGQRTTETFEILHFAAWTAPDS
jgi:hypothetical protein